MTYMLAADIYLGDVSSQVYEFLLEPRPCIFLNGHNVPWQDNPYYSHWTLGQVIDDVKKGLRPRWKRLLPAHSFCRNSVRHLPTRSEWSPIVQQPSEVLMP